MAHDEEQTRTGIGWHVPDQVGPGQTVDKSILDLHTAEYDALTARCTSWLAFQVPIWAALVGFLTLVGLKWETLPPDLRLWGTLLGFQLIVLIWFQTIEEQYRAIKYLELYLRPQVEGLVKRGGFWLYEPYSAGRDDHLSWIGEWTVPAITTAFGVAVVATQPWPGWPEGWYWVTPNALLLGVQVAKTIARVSLRREIAANPRPTFPPAPPAA